ncbi:GNAT family N-acetyltransferase [Flavobacteriaceae bacterium]|nr:GNAT family N-acetyltransferase [Flavobacteriaceae bacterium]
MPKTEIVTQRLKLRLIDLSDLESIHELHSLPESDKYNALGIPETIDETKSVIQPWILEHQSNEIKNYTFAIDNNLNGTFMGLFGVKLGIKNIRELRFGIKFILIIGIKAMQQNP